LLAHNIHPRGAPICKTAPPKTILTIEHCPRPRPAADIECRGYFVRRTSSWWRESNGLRILARGICPVRVPSPRERGSRRVIPQPRAAPIRDAAPLEWIPSDKHRKRAWSIFDLRVSK